MLRRTLWLTLTFALLMPILLYVLPIHAEHNNRPTVFATNELPTAPIYLQPQPDAQFVSPQTTIAIRYGVNLDPSIQDSARFTVTGAQSGQHAGHTVLADDQQTIIFIPDQPFALYESVNVSLNLGSDAAGDVAFHFTTALADPAVFKASNLAVSLGNERQAQPSRFLSTPADTLTDVKAARVATETYHTLPADFPQITVTTPANGVDNGYLFLSNFQSTFCSHGAYLLMLDNAGEPAFYRALPPCGWADDFKRQSNGLLTYWDKGTGVFHALDNTYTEVDTFQAGHGHSTDSHDLQILANDHALLMSYDTQVISNTDGVVPNGRMTATVMGLIVQELDATKNVVFEWRSWDHFQITDTTDIYLQTEPVDYVHGNAIALDTDGNLLLSSRHLNEITKINRQTGAIIWRLGGKHNQFTFVGDNRPFSHQHDIRRLPNGNITLYDNGNLATPSYSRAVEYRLDEKKKIATLVHEYRNTPDTSGLAMGSNQKLSNNNVLVGWGLSSLPAITEFGLDGTKRFELALSSPNINYRAFRFNWQGYPTTEPTLVAITDTTPSLYYSWNGATEILGYRVYGGTTAEPATLIDTTFKTGFETQTILDAVIDKFCYFRVMPIDKQGHDTRYSNTVFIDLPACQPTATPTSTPISTETPTETPTPMETVTPIETLPPVETPTPPTGGEPSEVDALDNAFIFLPLIHR